MKTAYAIKQLQKYGTVTEVRPGVYLAKVGGKQARFVDRDGSVALYPAQTSPWGSHDEPDFWSEWGMVRDFPKWLRWAAGHSQRVEIGNGDEAGVSFEVGKHNLDPTVVVTVRLRTDDPVACEMARGVASGETPSGVLVDYLKDQGVVP
jgi:hypothetical protein